MQDPTPPSQPNTEVHRIDGIVRMMMWGLLIFTGVNQLSANGTVSVREYFIPFTIFALLMAGYVLVSVQSVAQDLHDYADQQPVLLALLPLLLVLPYALYAREQPEFDPATLLASGMLLFLPTACALLNTPQLKRSDVMIGLVTVALPLVGPLLRNEAIERTDLFLRLGALALPVLLLLLTNRQQKQKSKFFVHLRGAVVVVQHRVRRLPRIHSAQYRRPELLQPGGITRLFVCAGAEWALLKAGLVV